MSGGFMQVRVDGLRDVERLLTEQLPERVRATVIARALREAAKPMLAAAKANAASLGGSGALALSMGIRRQRKGVRGNTVASVYIGPIRGNKAALARYFAYYGKRPTPKQLRSGIRHGHLVEWGTRRTPARRFMQRAFDAHARDAVRIFGKDIGGFIEREAAKIARGAR